jgi:hypothetical protein
MADDLKCFCCGHPVKPGEVCRVCGNVTGEKPAKKERTK